MAKDKFTRHIYVDGKLCSKPASPNRKGLIVVQGETEAAVVTPYISLIIREIVKEQTDVLDKPVPKETTSVAISRHTGSVLETIQDKFDKIQLQSRKWSGFTFINEGLRRYNDIIYTRELNKILPAREKWNSLQKKLVKVENRILHIGAGPMWFQEPSHKQIALVTQLGDILKADSEEGIISRTKQFLADLGVVPNICAKDILKGMKESYLDPINFLLEMHAAVAKRQNKKDEDKTFSTNERLLLTAVCTLHLPFLLTLLHIMLPLPKSNKEDVNIKAECLDTEIQYCCPYLEPLVCRGMVWLEQQINQQLKRALLELYGIPLDYDSKTDGEEQIEVARDKRFSVMITNPTISRYLNICAEEASKMGSVESFLKEMRKSVESTSEDKTPKHQTFYVKRLSLSKKKLSSEIMATSSGTTLQDSEKKPGTVVAQEELVKEVLENPISLNTPDILKGIKQTIEVSDLPEKLINVQTMNQEKDKNLLKDISPPTPLALNYSNIDYAKMTVNTNLGTDELRYKLSTHKKQTSCEELLKCEGSMKQEVMEEVEPQLVEQEVREEVNQQMKEEAIPQNEVDLKNINPSETDSVLQSNISIELLSMTLDTSENTSSQESLPKSDIIQHLLDTVEMIPKKYQLRYILKLLSAVGDPLAQLPDCHKLSSMKRRCELRDGIRTKLTPKYNAQLLEASRMMWTSSPISTIPVPKIRLSKKEERALTWDKRNWLRKKIDKEFTRYLSELKQQKINSARAFFPTMFTQYYNKSKVNHDFRKCFYTYLPSREADIFVYRPWKLDENKHLGDD